MGLARQLRPNQAHYARMQHESRQSRDFCSGQGVPAWPRRPTPGGTTDGQRCSGGLARAGSGELGRLLDSLFMALEEDLFRASQSECDGEEDAGDEEEAATFAQ